MTLKKSMSHILLMLAVMCALPAAGSVPAAYPQAQEQDLDQGAANLDINVQEEYEVESSTLIVTPPDEGQLPPEAGSVCPEGFTLNRGVCETEPTLTCENYNIHFDLSRVHMDENGQCIYEQWWAPTCVYDPITGRLIEDYSYAYMSCRDMATNTLTDTEPKCEYTAEPDHPINDAVLRYTERGEANCVTYEEIGPADPKCDVGTLNPQTGMCEVRPGRY
jgi:hypothetical protein